MSNKPRFRITAKFKNGEDIVYNSDKDLVWQNGQYVICPVKSTSISYIPFTSVWRIIVTAFDETDAKKDSD